MAVERVTGLRVCRSAFRAAMDVFEASKTWPKEEHYALTDQIRRSSRAVWASFSEAWRKRRNLKHVVSKISDADAEAAETRTWLRFARAREYVDPETFETLDQTCDRLCGGRVQMMRALDKGCGPSNTEQDPPLPYAAD